MRPNIAFPKQQVARRRFTDPVRPPDDAHGISVAIDEGFDSIFGFLVTDDSDGSRRAIFNRNFGNTALYFFLFFILRL
tara:strand:- start:250 stop:483 length:234 start_codon:yes stop_codon:yes gene_type:complete